MHIAGEIPESYSDKIKRLSTQESQLNKAELIDTIVKETELSKAAAGHALNAALDTIVKAAAKKQDVQLICFGTFKAAVNKKK